MYFTAFKIFESIFREQVALSPWLRNVMLTLLLVCSYQLGLLKKSCLWPGVIHSHSVGGMAGSNANAMPDGAV